MRGTWTAAVLAGLLMCVLGASFTFAGMAELGQKRSGFEAGDDEAAGDGEVILRVDGNEFTFDTVTAPANTTVSDIFEDLEGQINGASVGLAAVHNAGEGEITVLGNGGAEIGSIEILTTDSGLTLVSASRSPDCLIVSVGPISQLSNDGEARIEIDNLTGRIATVSTGGLSPAQLNSALVAALVNQGFQAKIGPAGIEVARDNVLGQQPSKILFEHDDSGIQIISARASGPQPIPTLSVWGLILFAGFLALVALLQLRRRRSTFVSS